MSIAPTARAGQLKIFLFGYCRIPRTPGSGNGALGFLNFFEDAEFLSRPRNGQDFTGRYKDRVKAVAPRQHNHPVFVFMYSALAGFHAANAYFGGVADAEPWTNRAAGCLYIVNLIVVCGAHDRNGVDFADINLFCFH